MDRRKKSYREKRGRRDGGKKRNRKRMIWKKEGTSRRSNK